MDDRYDPNLILAYVEGELDDDGRARFDRLCATDPALRELADQMRADRDAVRGLPREQPSSAASATVTAMLERDLLLGDATLDDGPTPIGAAPSAPAAGHRLFRFVAYSGIAAAIALTGAVVVQTLTGTGLLDRARQLADSTPAPAAKDTNAGSGSGLALDLPENAAGLSDADRDAVALSRLAESDAQPAEDAATDGLAVLADGGGGAGLGGEPARGNAAMMAEAQTPPAASAPVDFTDAQATGRSVASAGIFGDTDDARLEADAVTEATGTAANAPMTLDGSAVTEALAFGDEAASDTELFAAMTERQPRNPADHGRAEVVRRSGFERSGVASTPHLVTLAVHTPEPDRLGREVSNWVWANGGVVLAQEAPAVNGSAEGLASRDRVESVVRRPESGEVAMKQVPQQLDVLIPSREVPAFYRQVQVGQAMGGRAGAEAAEEKEAADQSRFALAEVDADAPQTRSFATKTTDMSLSTRADEAELPAAERMDIGMGMSPVPADQSDLKRDRNPSVAQDALAPPQRRAVTPGEDDSFRENRDQAQPAPPSAWWTSSYWFDARAQPEAPVRIRVLIRPATDTEVPATLEVIP